MSTLASVILKGVASALPSAGIPGRVYITTDANAMYRDNGTTWDGPYLGPGNAITALIGDVTAAGPGSATATLATSGVTAGSYTSANITVDAKGRVTVAANGTGGGGGDFTTPPATLSAPSGSTTYTLPGTPVNPTASFYFVNGVKKKYGVFYSISGTTLTLLIPAQAPTTGDSHEIYYS